MAGNDNSLMTLSELIGREPPYMIDAERAILAAVLVEPALFTEVMQIIRKPEYFYDEYIRGLYSCCYWLESQGKPIDLVTVIDQAVETGVFTTQEMARNYLKQLLDGFITKGNVADYCRIIEDKYYVRTLIDVSTELIKRASEKNVKSDELLDLAEQMIYDIRSGKFANGLLPLETVIMDVYDHLQELTGADRDKFKGISTGFSSIDKVMMGLNNTDLIILAARPGMGKSAFALNVAVNAAKASHKDTVVFSLEMSPEQVATRMLSSEALVSHSVLHSGDFGQGDSVWQELASGTERLVKLPIYIDGTANITVPEMKAKLRRRQGSLGLVVIDYLQLMSSPNHHNNRVQEVSEITRQLKLMAKELQVPVIALSQLSREAEKRENKRPMLSDLRESGSIEQDADIILFLYRDAYYNDQATDLSVAECSVAKNRHGQLGTINLVWRGEYMLFTDADTIHREN
ncbi:MAG: replicative DNA helicase [Ruminococcus sp.]|nr:replicative DNA helicase [Ruminococcus sp.]